MTDDKTELEKEPVAPAELPQGENEESTEQPSEIVDPRKQEMQAEQDQINEDTRTNLERSDKEARSLAKTMAMMNSPEDANSLLQEYFEAKQDLYGFGDPQTLAKEIMLIENNLIGNLISQINEQYPNPNDSVKEKINIAIESVRTALYGIVLNGSLTGEKVVELLSGGIEFSKMPQAENIDNQTVSFEKVFAHVRVDLKKIYVYDNFIFGEAGKSVEPEVQSNRLRHEFAHIIAENGCIWDLGDYHSFLTKVLRLGPNETLSDVPPTLALLMDFMNNPDTNILWSGDIVKQLEKMQTLPDEQKGQARVNIVREMVADIIASYFEANNSPEAFFDRRMQYTAEDDIIESMVKLSGKSDRDEFYRYYHIHPQTKPSEMIEMLASRKEFRPLFTVNKEWFALLLEKFAERGKYIEETESRELVDDDVFVDDGDDSLFNTSTISGGGVGGDNYSSEKYGPDTKSKSPLLGIWNFLTGSVQTKE